MATLFHFSPTWTDKQINWQKHGSWDDKPFCSVVPLSGLVQCFSHLTEFARHVEDAVAYEDFVPCLSVLKDEEICHIYKNIKDLRELLAGDTDSTALPAYTEKNQENY